MQTRHDLRADDLGRAARGPPPRHHHHRAGPELPTVLTFTRRGWWAVTLELAVWGSEGGNMKRLLGRVRVRRAAGGRELLHEQHHARHRRQHTRGRLQEAADTEGRSPTSATATSTARTCRARSAHLEPDRRAAQQREAGRHQPVGLGAHRRHDVGRRPDQRQPSGRRRPAR